MNRYSESPHPDGYECPFCGALVARTIISDEPGCNTIKWICRGRERHEFGDEWAERPWGQSEPAAVLVGLNPWGSSSPPTESNNRDLFK
jgi:hypothetical protein